MKHARNGNSIIISYFSDGLWNLETFRSFNNLSQLKLERKAAQSSNSPVTFRL